MPLTRNLERDSNNTVKTFVNTVNEAGIPDEVLNIKLPGNEGKSVKEFSEEDFKTVIKDELDKPAYAKAFKEEEEKNNVINMFAQALKRGVEMKQLSDGFQKKINAGTLKANEDDMEKIGNAISQYEHMGQYNNVQDEMAKIKDQIDIRTLPENNILNLITKTTSGLSYFNSIIGANLEIQETEMLIAEDKELTEAKKTAQDLNRKVYEDYPELTEEEKEKFEVNYNKFDNKGLLETREEAIQSQKRNMQIVGTDFEEKVFVEDLEKTEKELKNIDFLEKATEEGIEKYFANPYKKQDALKNFQDITNKKSPFYVSEELADLQKSVDNPFANPTPAQTPARQKALTEYLDKLNKKLTSYGYQGKITSLPNKEKRTELFNIMVQNNQKEIQKLEEKGVNRKAFTDKEAFQTELKDRRETIHQSEILNRSRALVSVKEKEAELQKMEVVLQKRSNVANANQKVMDSAEKLSTSLKNSKVMYFAKDGNISDQLKNLSKRLNDKKNPFHIDTSSFKKLKNSMEKLNGKFYLDPEESTQALREIHEAAKDYLEKKGKQNRKKPSEMRLSRLATAEEILKVTGAYLKAHDTLEKNAEPVNDIKDKGVDLESGIFRVYRENANLTVSPREKIAIPSLKHKVVEAQKVQEKAVENKENLKQESAPQSLNY